MLLNKSDGFVQTPKVMSSSLLSFVSIVTSTSSAISIVTSVFVSLTSLEHSSSHGLVTSSND